MVVEVPEPWLTIGLVERVVGRSPNFRGHVIPAFRVNTLRRRGSVHVQLPKHDTAEGWKFRKLGSFRRVRRDVPNPGGCRFVPGPSGVASYRRWAKLRERTEALIYHRENYFFLTFQPRVLHLRFPNLWKLYAEYYFHVSLYLWRVAGLSQTFNLFSRVCWN